MSKLGGGGPGLSAATVGDRDGDGGIATVGGEDGGAAVTIRGGVLGDCVSESSVVSSAAIPVGKPTGYLRSCNSPPSVYGHGVAARAASLCIAARRVQQTAIMSQQQTRRRTPKEMATSTHIGSISWYVASAVTPLSILVGVYAIAQGVGGGNGGVDGEGGDGAFGGKSGVGGGAQDAWVMHVSLSQSGKLAGHSHLGTQAVL